jgi:hypothetical protein
MRGVIHQLADRTEAVMRRGLRFAIAALFVTTAACRHGAAADAGDMQPHVAPVSVNVTNNSQSSMEIFVIGGGTTYRIGSVAPGIPRRFELRPAMLAAGGHVQFMAQASGAGPRVQTDEVIVSPGDEVDFEITTSLVGSRATVKPR